MGSDERKSFLSDYITKLYRINTANDHKYPSLLRTTIEVEAKYKSLRRLNLF
jgi:hypothetical protein